MRLAFQESNFYVGGIKAGLMTLTGGVLPGGKIDSHSDAEVPRDVTEPEPFVPDGKLTFSKLDANFKSGNATRDDIPSHLDRRAGHHSRSRASCTRTCVRRVSTSATVSGSSSVLRTASIAKRRM